MSSAATPALAHALRAAAGLLARLLGVFTLGFLLLELAPGTPADTMISPDLDPAQREKLLAKFGYDRPLAVRYALALRALLGADLGVSFVSEQPVTQVIGAHLPHTLLLSGAALAVIFPLGVALGVLSAVARGHAIERTLSVVALVAWGLPSFWLALMLQLGASRVGWPTSGRVDPVMHDLMGPWEQLLDVATHLALPTVSLAIGGTASVARYVRASMLEALSQDYIRTARARGLSELRVVGRHALRNALLPVITLVGLSLPALVGGSVLVEVIYGWPGMGKLTFDAIQAQDQPVLLGCLLLFAAVVSLANGLADALYAVADTRVRARG